MMKENLLISLNGDLLYILKEWRFYMRSKFFLIVLICFVFVIGYWERVEGAEFMDFGPYQGKVVDIDTKEPVEGAVVFVSWRQSHFFGGSTFIDAQETLTDKNGEFHLPGIWAFNPWKRLVSDALMIIYKSGYQPIITGAWKKWKEFDPLSGPPTRKYVLKVEDGKPVMILKKLTIEERKRASASDPSTTDIPGEKKKLLLQEINKDYNFKYPSKRR
jgi:hypothetical protein